MFFPDELEQTSTFCRLPTPILENIGFEVTVIDPLGPPRDLIPLLQTCKCIYHVLSFDNNGYFYARIFRFMFDHRAAYRRLGARATNTPNQAAQLKANCIALTRIRHGDIRADTVLDDLWTCFFMMVESDGKNEVQLLEYAGLKEFIDKLVRERLREGQEAQNGWPAESTFNALALWLLWFTMDDVTLNTESPESRRSLMEIVRPYVVLPLRYPSFHAPDNHFDFPLRLNLLHLPFTHMTPHGFYPPYRTPQMQVSNHIRYGLPIEIGAPPITLAAKLIYFARSEATPFTIPTNIRATRAEGPQGDPSPTQEDYRKFNEHKAAKSLERGKWDWRNEIDEEEGTLEDDGVWRKGLKAMSARWDNDWHRWSYCWDPWHVSDLKGVVYTYGSLNGVWLGRMLLPDINQYFSMVTSQNFVAHIPMMTTVPISLRLREHHCINPELTAAAGGSVNDALDDGICNAWFATDAAIRETSEGVRIDDPRRGGSVHWYEKYREDKPNSHKEDTCNQCKDRRKKEEEELEQRVRAHRAASQEEEDDESTTLSDEERLRRERGRKAKAAARSPSTALRRRPHSQSAADAMPGVSPPDGPSSGMSTSVNPNIVSHVHPNVASHVHSNVASHVHAETQEVTEADMDDMVTAEFDSADAESEWDEYVENTCTGIQDIVITGETLPSHAQAWQHYRFYGRVRRWDGLVALVRKPTNKPELGIAIFRGYIVANQYLVGNWRAFTVNAHAIPLEGPFIASRSTVEE